MSAAIGGPLLFPCRPPPKRGYKEAVGSLPGQYGTIARQPGWNARGRQMLARQRARELCEKARHAHVSACLYDAARQQLEEHSTVRHLAGRARHRFSLALRAADADLDIRRHKLQDMLMCEDAQLTAELVARQQRAPLERLQAQLQQVRAAQAQEAEAERKEVERLRNIQYRDKCIELREKKKEQADRDAKDVQKYQIHERQWLKELQRENEQFWADVQKKNFEAAVEYEEDVERAAFSRNLQQARDNLALGEAAKRGAQSERLAAMREERRFMEAAEKQATKEKLEYDERRLAQKKGVAQSLCKQRHEERMKNQWVEETDRRFDLVSLAFAKEELERTVQGISERKEDERRERRLFREYKLHEKRQQHELQLLMDKAYNEVAADANRCREQRRTEFKEAAARLEKETFACRAQQLDEKRAEAARCAQAAEVERCRVEQLRREHKALEDHARRQERDRQCRYAKELVEQQRYSQIVKERECQLERERMAVQMKETQDQYRLAQELLENPNPKPPHPLMECLARYPPPQEVNQAPDMSAPCWPVDPRGQRDPPVAFASDAAAAAAIGRGVPGAMAAAAAAAQRETAMPARIPYPSTCENCKCCGGVRYPPPSICENCERLKKTRAAFAVGHKLHHLEIARQNALPALAIARAERAGFPNVDHALNRAVERTGAGSGVTGLPPITGEVHVPPPQAILPNSSMLQSMRPTTCLPQTLMNLAPKGGKPLRTEMRGGPATAEECRKLQEQRAAAELRPTGVGSY